MTHEDRDLLLAVQVMARAVVARVLKEEVEFGRVAQMWELWPDVAELDWSQVTAGVMEWAERLEPDQTATSEAYAYLQTRVDPDAEANP